MIYIITNVIEIVSMIVLFITVHLLIKKLKIEKEIYNKDIESLNRELDTFRQNDSMKDIHRLIEVHKANSVLIDTLDKIKRNYTISKHDKIVIIQWLIVRLNLEDDYTLLSNINTSKKYTFNQAADIIKDYIKDSLKENISIQESLNAAFYLILK